MSHFANEKNNDLQHGCTRRDFLRAGSLSAGAAGIALANLDLAEAGATTVAARDMRCILLFLVGGPSQLDTWDPKPSAPSSVRGPFRPIRTSVPGVYVSEHFSRMARLAQHVAIVRSVHHHEAPIHETGHQLMQTGHLFRNHDYPHYGAALSYLRGPAQPGVSPFVILPGPLGNTGVSISHGQDAGFLGASYAPTFADITGDGKDTFDRYGRSKFGQYCRMARQLVEQGVRLVTVNMFDSVFNKLTWDCHADGGALATTLDDYATTLCPMFDLAYSALIEDLHQRRMLDSTLVVAMGEFGRTPRLNPRGGRDHWPGVWSILMAGGGIRGGQVVGSSDRIGAEPKDRPVTPAEVAATIYHALGISPATRIPTPDDRLVPLVEAEPIRELFRG